MSDHWRQNWWDHWQFSGTDNPTIAAFKLTWFRTQINHILSSIYGTTVNWYEVLVSFFLIIFDYHYQRGFQQTKSFLFLNKHFFFPFSNLDSAQNPKLTLNDG